MKFSDSKLQRCYGSNLAESGNSSDELRQVRALLAVRETFAMFEGAHSTRVHETVDHLLLPGLRRWYQRAHGDRDPAALAFRDHLNHLAGERLEAVENIPHYPS